MKGHQKEEDVRQWEVLYERLRETLRQFGTEDISRTADFWIDDDDWGHRQQKVYVRNLELLRPHVVQAMQKLLADLPSWEIVVAVSVPGPGDAWPDMGLNVRAHEIVDDLKRQHFPPDYQGIKYAGSRPPEEGE